MSTSGVNLNSMGLNSSTVSSGNGIDVTSVVSQLMDAARGPKRRWQQQQSALTSQTNALNSTSRQALARIGATEEGTSAIMCSDRE